MKTVIVNNKTYTLAPDGTFFRPIDATLAIVSDDPKGIYDDFKAAESFEVQEDGQTVGIYANFNHVLQARYVGDAITAYDEGGAAIFGGVVYVMVERVNLTEQRLAEHDEALVDLTDAILG